MQNVNTTGINFLMAGFLSFTNSLEPASLDSSEVLICLFL